MTLERGSFLNKRYRIVEILGQGGMGSIYRAVDENLGVEVAVKENLFTTEEFARQFHREASILASLRHPNLPRVTDHFAISGQGQYLVMDFIEGEDLRERMDRSGNLTDAEVVVLGVAICEALSYLHSRIPQVLHRDIKPGNVKVSPSGQVCLVDFGLAKVVQGSQTTTTGARAMTPGYSPPEQYGTSRTDQRTDIYSLGATLYVALTGVIPEDALARAMGQAELTPIRKLNPKVSKRLAGVIEKAVELRPDDRFQSTEELKQALLNSRVITGRKTPAEMTLSPPPATAAEEELGSNGSPAGEGSPGEVNTPIPSAGGHASPFLHTSSPLPEPFTFRDSKPLKRKRSRGCMFRLALAAMVVIGSLGLYIYQPSWFDQAVAWFPPLSDSVGAGEASGTAEPPIAPAALNSPSPTPSQTPTTEPEENQVQLLASPATSTPTPTQTEELESTTTPATTATPMGGGMGELAYASNLTGLPQIWLISADGTSQRQITDMPEGACQPDWSPDGSKVVFISPCASNQEIYPGASLFVINADGSGLTPLPTTPGGDFDPAWSPDGKKIAFTSLRDYNRSQIYVINLEDSSVESVSANTVRDSQPAWSPDGERIAFVSTRRGPYQIWTMAKDGSDPKLFTRSGSLKNSKPAWTRDGQAILFTQSEVLGGIPRLVAVRLGEGIHTENRIIPDRTPMREAVYSPDGFWIAFESWPDGVNHNIYIMTVNGLARQQVTSEVAYDFDPAWRPVSSQP